LLDNEAPDRRELLGSHTEGTKKRAEGQRVILCPNDTTESDFTSQPEIKGLGRLSYDAQHGMYVHPLLLVTPEGSVSGVADTWMWARKPHGKADFKESVRWIEGYRRVADLAAEMPESRLVYIGDREGDIRDLMETAGQCGYPADFLLRARHERNTAAGGKLWRNMGKEEAAGRIEFTLPRAPGRKARQVIQTLYVKRVTPPARKNAQGRLEEPLELTAILAREENPPEGQKAVEWRLLTNRTAVTLEEAAELIEWYRCRWLIEIFFRILKSGCKVENLQSGTIKRIERALVIYMVIAWRILHLVTWGRECPELPCDVLFDKEEWETAWVVTHRTKPPEIPPTLNVMTRMIAAFGGFLGRRHDGHPGPKAIWEGMIRVQEFFIGLEAARVAYAGDG
jgi:hypothetical protein